MTTDSLKLPIDNNFAFRRAADNNWVLVPVYSAPPGGVFILSGRFGAEEIKTRGDGFKIVTQQQVEDLLGPEFVK